MFADAHDIGKISVYFTLYAVAVFLVRPFSGKIMDQKGLRYTVFPGMAGYPARPAILASTNPPAIGPMPCPISPPRK